MRAKLRASLPFSIILFCGIIFRTVAWGALPNGYYWDEVSSGYESWSLALTGAESWGSSLPVYFLQQSGGQNVLYSYLNMPFIALFGPSMLGVRLLMLLLGIATLPLLYLTVKRWYGHTVGLTAMGLLAVLPWHVMLSRYGLESSLLPFVFLLAVYTIGRALMDGKPFFIISAGVVLALCVYAYAVVCVPIAVFVLGLAFVYRKQLREQRQYWLLALLIFILLDVPFGLFLAQNYLHLFFIAPGTLPFSIPALTANRLQDLRSTGVNPLFGSLREVFILGSNSMNEPRMNTVPYGQVVPIVLPLLAVVGMVLSLLRPSSRPADKLNMRLNPILIWFFASLTVWFLIPVEANENNMFYLPMVVLAAMVMVQVLRFFGQRREKMVVFIGVIALGLGVLLPPNLAYFFGDYNKYAARYFNPHLDTALAVAVKAAAGKPLYVSSVLPLNYLNVLWLEKIPPQKFRSYHPSPINPDFENFVFSTARLRHGTSYWFLAYNEGIYWDTATCAHPLHQQVVENTWRIGYCPT